MNIIIIDDDPIVSTSLKTILEAEDDITVSATGCDGDEALHLWKTLQPDIVLMDIQMPKCSGLDAAEAILHEDPQARIVFLTTFSDDEYIVHALKLGARGYLIKQDVGTIAFALRSVMAGQSVLEGEILERATLLSSGTESSLENNLWLAEDEAFKMLSQRERDVVSLVAEGLDNGEIAERLFISEGTVRNHISAILTKLDLKNRTQIAVYYYRQNRNGHKSQ
ncbi:MAG: response regulator [Eggerthellaceae bacterium]|jgi:DNA-binding NarL/FixJ family response regulator